MSTLKTMEIKFFGRTAGYTLLVRKRNESLEEQGAESVENKINRYKFNWIHLVTRKEYTRIPKLMMPYKPRGRQKPGRTLRRMDFSKIEQWLLSMQVIFWKTLPLVSIILSNLKRLSNFVEI